MKRKENHIWPAYVDMMTVLLLVYILVSLLFATMIKSDTEAKYNELLNSISRSTAEDKQQLGGLGTLEPQLEMIAADDHQDMLTSQQGDLILNLLPNAESLTPQEEAALTTWYQQNRAEVIAKGIYFGVVAQKRDDISLGALYRKQYMLYMDALRYLTKTESDFKPANFIHRSPAPSGDIKQEYMLFRIADE